MNRFSKIISKIATRPIHIDRGEVLRALDSLRRYTKIKLEMSNKTTNDKIGEIRFHCERKIHIKAVNEEELEIAVHYLLKDVDSFDMVLSGSVGHEEGSRKPVIVIFLNSDNTYNEMFEIKKDKFMNEFVKMMEHEITHHADIFEEGWSGVSEEEYHDIDEIQTTKDWTIDDYKNYYNNSKEVRGYMRTVYDEVLEKLPKLYKHGININAIMKGLEGYSLTWGKMKKYLTEANKKLILKGVFQAIDDWIDEQKQGETK